MRGCCYDNDLCSFHAKYPTLFYYKCVKCGNYEGSSMINGHDAVIDSLKRVGFIGESILKTSIKNYIPLLQAEYKDMIIYEYIDRFDKDVTIP